ncbi:alpha/beta fold hydrolase [Herbiconiux sp. 11R-BC]|uniref:alpha/beta fold hydrolase n=1 Tax=Herbiconiux sp. 11R-BC TaxID=3111637 RepID=UPI003C09FB23
MTSNDADNAEPLTPVPFPVTLHTLHWGPPPTTDAHGPDARPIALLLHGLPSAAGTWWQVASGLAAAGWSVTAPDLRGHGASPRTTRYALDDYAADVAALVPAAGRRWDVVVGHSLGGAVATVAAGAHPDWTSALLLLDPVFAVPEGAVPGLLAELLADLEALDPAALLREHPRWHSEDAVQKVAAARVASPYLIERTVLDNERWQLEPVAAALRPRVHVLAADPQLGASFTVEEGERLARANPRFRYSVVAGSGHSVQRDDPRRVVEEAQALAAAC